MPPISRCNLDIENSIKNITASVREIPPHEVSIWLDYKPKKIRVALWCTEETKPFINVEADNETQGLIQLTIKICDKGIEGPPDASPSESDIIVCAKSALMEDGEFSVKYIGSEPTITGASLVVGGSKTLATVSGEGEDKCRFQLMKKICEMGLGKPTSPNSTQVEQNGEDK